MAASSNHFLAGKCKVIAALLAVFTTISAQDVSVTPQELTVLPGETFTMLCAVTYPVQYCRMTLPGQTTISINNKTNSRENNIYYHGSGLENGQCGFKRKAEEKDNGMVTCAVNPPDNELKEREGKMKLTVAKSPSNPEIKTSRGSIAPSIYKANDELGAICTSLEGRPAAKLSWYLDDELLSTGVHHPVTKTVAGTNDYETATLNLTRRLVPSDNGKFIICVAEHITFNAPGRSAKQQLQVQFEPQPRERQIEVYGIKIGESGKVSVTIQANPMPHFQWKVNGQVINEGTVDSERNMEALSAVPVGQGYYNATLNINTVTKEDTEHDYILEAYNDQGAAEYVIKISTLDEPQGVDLDAGAIVGIVISVLVILVLIFLLIFAKATNRWCFAAQSPKSRNIGESDTESADAGHLRTQEEAAKAKDAPSPKVKESPISRAMAIPRSINLKQFLPGGAKNKDKVSQVEQQTEQMETKLEEEAKPLQSKTDQAQENTLIYAELSLKPSESQQPAPPAEKVEYAEIVYKPKTIENKQDAKK